MAFKFSDQSGQAEISCELADNIVYVKFSVNGADEKWFVLDSGATFTGIDSSYAEKAGLDLSEKYVSPATGMTLITVKGVSLKTGGAEFSDQTVKVMPLTHLSMFTGREIAGIIGFDIFNETVVKISYSEKKVVFFEPSGFVYNGAGIKGGLEIIKKWPVAQAVLTSAQDIDKTYKLIIDTGSMTAFSLFEGDLAGNTISTGMSMGIGGAGGAGRIGRLKRAVLGGIEYKNPHAAFPPEGKTSGGDGLTDAIASVSSGITGGELLSRFDLTFDYSRSCFYAEKNSKINEPMEYDMGGMVILSEAPDFNNFQVYIVTENTPAEKAGIHQGDRITGINGRPSSDYRLWEIRDLLRKHDTECSFTLDRDGKDISAVLDLKRLI